MLFTTVILVIFHVPSLQICLDLKPFVRYHKIRSCFKSAQAIISWMNTDNFMECSSFAREKNGLAFNFSPPEAENFTKTVQNCQILACPELDNSSTLVPDLAFDYYSAYGNLNATENATCLKSIGIFAVVEEKLNYQDSIKYCQDLGADLADILGETRTNFLANLLNTSIQESYKAAYVGLDDSKQEGRFETPMGNLLGCTDYRAWSPGHPRPRKAHDDCVILDAQKVWKAVNCNAKLNSICEFFPEEPQEKKVGTKANCSSIKNKKKKKKCLEDRKLYEIYETASRVDKCALMEDYDWS